MPEFINGLPLHVLVIHAVVVFVPLGALGTAVIAFWPAARRRIGWVVAGVVAVGTAMTPIAAQSGELLQARLPQGNPLIVEHADLGGQLIYFVAPQLLAVLGLMIAHTAQQTAQCTEGANPGRAKAVVIAVAVVAVGLSAAATVHVFRVGEAGSRAVWEGVANLPAP